MGGASQNVEEFDAAAYGFAVYDEEAGAKHPGLDALFDGRAFTGVLAIPGPRIGTGAPMFVRNPSMGDKGAECERFIRDERG